MADYSKLLEEALLLDEQDRVLFVEKLLASLDEDPHNEIERLWLDEAERRLAGLRGGTSKTIPSDEVSTNVERLFR